MVVGGAAVRIARARNHMSARQIALVAVGFVAMTWWLAGPWFALGASFAGLACYLALL